MIKTITFGEKEVNFSTSFGWTFIYKSQFGKDPAAILMPAIKDIQASGSNEDAGFALIESLGFSCIAQMAWAMAKAADKRTANLDVWIDSFGDDFSIMDIVTELIPDAIGSFFNTKK